MSNTPHLLIGVPAETAAGETRVAATPETVKKLVAQGHSVRVQSGAGVAASVTDEAYAAAGATLVDAAQAWNSNLVLKVRAPEAAEVSLIHKGSTVMGMLEPFNREGLERLAAAGATGFALEAAHAPPAHKAWTCSRAKPTSQATRPSCWRLTNTNGSSPC